MSWDFAKRLSPPLRAATERRINIVPRITTLLQEAPVAQVHEAYLPAIGLAATRPINSSLQQVEKFGPSPRQLYQRTWAHGIDP